MTAGNDKKELRKGEKFVVTVQEVLHNTLMVFLEYRKVKFCGVLLNTSNRRAPYGISEKPVESYYRSHGIDPKKIAAQEKEELEKTKDLSPPNFPEPIQTRTTYAQKLHLPPPRQIYMRRRRSKRKVRMDMINTDLAFKILTDSQKYKPISHPESCCCDKCISDIAGGDSDGGKVIKGKRKLMLNSSTKINSKPKSTVSYEDMAAIPSNSKRAKIEPSANKTPTEIVRASLKEQPTSSKRDTSTSSKQDASSPFKRSPVIKISYKSPGGKGRVLKIPSKIHSPPSRTADPTKKAMQERARKAVFRAKSEHFKYLQDQKPGDTRKQLKMTKTVTEKQVKFNDNQIAPKPIINRDKLSPIRFQFTAKPSPRAEHHVKNNALSKVIAGSSESDSGKDLESISKDLSKRLSRSLTPQVMLQPLLKSDTKNGSEEISIAKDVSAALEMPDGEEASISGGSAGTSPSKRSPSQLSHTISVTRCTTGEGVKWCQGDVVWGKIQGFPWWPGLLKRIMVKKGPNSIEQIAIVDWFQSKTISHIPCSKLESFSGNYHKRFSKKIKGNYKKAIQEAHEAEKNMSREVRKLIMQFET